ncbi:MAG TPA: hypothetical protein VFX50_00975, partial [Gemmatimonadales bacterium]|nr:hypothetical protein [Gemmatimonadales bacterium]
AESPYVVAARGGDRTSYLVLEDSLARYAIGLAADGSPRAPGARPAARPQRRPGEEADVVQPRRNRPVPRGGRRVEAEP